MANENSGVSLDESMPYIARELAECVTSSISAMGPTKTKHSVVQMAVEAACNVDILTK